MRGSSLDSYNLSNISHHLDKLANSHPDLMPAHTPLLLLEIIRHQEEDSQEGRGFILSLGIPYSKKVKNRIGDMEISTIPDHRWTSLRKLNLCTCRIKEGTTTLERPAAATLAKPK